ASRSRRRRCGPAAAPRRAWSRRTAWAPVPRSPRRRTPDHGSPARPAAGGSCSRRRCPSVTPSHRRYLSPREPLAQGARVYPDRLAQVLEAVGPAPVAARHVRHGPLVRLTVASARALGPLSRGDTAAVQHRLEHGEGQALLRLGETLPGLAEVLHRPPAPT